MRYIWQGYPKLKPGGVEGLGLTFPIRDFSEYSCTFPAKTA
jgi:hypothetical protein